MRLYGYCVAFFSFLPLGFLFAQTDSLQFQQIQSIAQETRVRFAPDRRIKQWQIEPRLRDHIWVLHGYTTEPEAIRAFRNTLTQNSIQFIDSIELLPAASLGARTYGLANVSVTNNRYEPRQSAEMATQMTMGMPLEILKKQGGYLLVRTPDGYISWTEDLMVAPMTRTELTSWNQGKRLVYSAYFGHAFSSADPASAVVTDLVAGNILQWKGEKKGFYAIALPDGRTGFIPKSSAMLFDQWLKSRTPTVGQVETEARVMMGAPYLWGGTSLKGVDCSGFIKTAYYLQGVILPRDASQQAGVGEVVDIMDHDTVSIGKALNNLQRGDLLFFSALKDGKPTGRVTHVAMYTGEGRFIHASGLVRTNSMRKGDPDYADWESRALVGARRVAGVKGDPGIVSVEAHPLYMK
jgi:SH3-like domain-containing protein